MGSLGLEYGKCNIYCILYILYVVTGLYNLNINHLKIKKRGRTCQRAWGGESREEKEGGTIRTMGGGYREVRG